MNRHSFDSTNLKPMNRLIAEQGPTHFLETRTFDSISLDSSHRTKDNNDQSILKIQAFILLMKCHQGFDCS